MPRSWKVYVVTSDLTKWPVAGFTVKHELGEWLLKQPEESRLWWHVWVMDSPTSNSGGRVFVKPDTPMPVELDKDEVIAWTQKYR